MSGRYILAVDQSTQGTKALLLNEKGESVLRVDRPHRQIIDERGWVEHDGEEIWGNLLSLVRELLEKAKLTGEEIEAIGISNQRETVIAFHKETGKPLYNAIVWQCGRGEAIARRLADAGKGDLICAATGVPLSPYFSAAKLAWIMENVPEAKELAAAGKLAMGTMDTYLVHRLTAGAVLATDYSNASRTQLFDIGELTWSKPVTEAFGIPLSALAEVRDSNGHFGETDVDGILPKKVPIRAVFGDSHAALYGHGAQEAGGAKATYGTGSSIMLNTGDRRVTSKKGIATSLAWGIDGKVSYCLEGNINYTGASVTWLKEDLELIRSASEVEALARASNPHDESVFVPAFTGLNAPYWVSDARGVFTKISRTTGKKELCRAVLDAIAMQITDIVELMKEEGGFPLTTIFVDGGPTKNAWLMQRQADLLQGSVEVPAAEELSALGAGYAAGIAVGLYDKSIFRRMSRTSYAHTMDAPTHERLRRGWKKAVEEVIQASK
ncbi:glycerol kinase GlpK [Selenomonas sp. TAMA-11512]|uniref:FGGY-family carbohydrate kinase n=1 Tax=Selenomonas sp. TAMA-11512 TaxID=3095337 RepID=UPI00308AEAE0|nr:glycerol kinase GlpK [Selenomonas sp. TAMA-11512]